MTFSTSESKFTPGTDNQGWWASREPSGDTTDNYVVGAPDTGGPLSVFRDFFTFDLSRLRGRVDGATLVLQRYQGKGEATETLGLFAVATPARRLNHNEGLDRGIFHDLGTGQQYGRFALPTGGGNGPLVRLPLNRAAVADINAARGQFFSIGGSLLTISGQDDYLFGNSQDDGPVPAVQQLVVQLSETG